MAKQAASVTRVYYDEFDISGDLTSAAFTVSPETPVTTTFADTGPRRVMANYDHDVSHLGLFEPVSGASDDFLFSGMTDTVDHYVTQLFAGTAIGDPAYDFIMRHTSEPRSAALAGAVLLNFDGAGSDGAVRGVVLGNSISTGAEALTGVNQGATTTPAEYAVIFRLLAFTGTSVTINVQESTDDGSGDAYANVSGLTSGALSTPSVVRVSTTSSTEAWKRLDLSGTYTSATIVVTAGTVAGT